MPKNFLQSDGWAAFQEHVGNSVWQINTDKIFANIIKHKLPFGRNYLYIPYGPVFYLEDIRSGLRDEVNNFLFKLKKLAKKEKSIFVKIEPQSDVVTELIYRRGFKKSGKHIQPRRTVVIDLKKKEEELCAAMHRKTRYNIKLATKKRLDFRQSEDVDMFWRLLKKTSEEDKFHTHKKEYYAKLLDFFKTGKDIKTRMVFMYYDDPPSPNGYGRAGKPIAGAIMLIYDDTVYYLHGAMDRKYKSMMAPYLMHWEIILWAKSKGYAFYDLWGVDAQKWPGVTRFKLGWGGQTIEYPGSFDWPVSKFWYLVYKLGRKLF